VSLRVPWEVGTGTGRHVAQVYSLAEGNKSVSKVSKTNSQS
jgi:hypothetical protein